MGRRGDSLIFENIQEQNMNSRPSGEIEIGSITAARHGPRPKTISAVAAVCRPRERVHLADLPERLRPAFTILGTRATLLPGHRFRLDGRPADLRRIVAAANSCLATRGLPQIDYPGLLAPAGQR
jgi:hypothetical protein